MPRWKTRESTSNFPARGLRYCLVSNCIRLFPHVLKMYCTRLQCLCIEMNSKTNVSNLHHGSLKSIPAKKSAYELSDGAFGNLVCGGRSSLSRSAWFQMVFSSMPMNSLACSMPFSQNDSSLMSKPSSAARSRGDLLEPAANILLSFGMKALPSSL